MEKPEQYLFVFEDWSMVIKTTISDDDRTSVDYGHLSIIRQSDFKELTCNGWVHINSEN
mgnify:CR=1 FL=1